MLELLLGVGLGAMVFTEHGRELGNKVGNSAIAAAKGMLKNGKKDEPSKRAAGAPGDNSSCS